MDQGIAQQPGAGLAGLEQQADKVRGHRQQGFQAGLQRLGRGMTGGNRVGASRGGQGGQEGGDLRRAVGL
ncbi:hypothetical protein G6F22_018793 [Rhizopus arrhizus]|nr:hypothetical protein G6F22_018793 [Rhizopus arrhizus]